MQYKYTCSFSKFYSTVKVILPERASNVELKTPYGVKRLPDEIHYTYLDYTGRTVVVLKKEMLVDLHIQNFQVEYTFDKMSIFYEPFLIVAFFFILFLTVALLFGKFLGFENFEN